MTAAEKHEKADGLRDQISKLNRFLESNKKAAEEREPETLGVCFYGMSHYEDEKNSTLDGSTPVLRNIINRGEQVIVAGVQAELSRLQAEYEKLLT